MSRYRDADSRAHSQRSVAQSVADDINQNFGNYFFDYPNEKPAYPTRYSGDSRPSPSQYPPQQHQQYSPLPQPVYPYHGPRRHTAETNEHPGILIYPSPADAMHQYPQSPQSMVADAQQPSRVPPTFAAQDAQHGHPAPYYAGEAPQPTPQSPIRPLNMSSTQIPPSQHPAPFTGVTDGPPPSSQQYPSPSIGSPRKADSRQPQASMPDKLSSNVQDLNASSSTFPGSPRSATSKAYRPPPPLELAPAFSLRDKQRRKGASLRFFLACILSQIALIVLFGLFMEFKTADLTSTFAEDYPLFQDIHAMIFVGFACLMTFLRKYGYSSITHNILMAAFAIQISMISVPWLQQAIPLESGSVTFLEKIYPNLNSLVDGDFAAAACVISLGAVLGKTSPLQLLIMTWLEVIIYSVNYRLMARFEVNDSGGSFSIHMFGAYFGLAASLIMTPPILTQELNCGQLLSETFSPTDVQMQQLLNAGSEVIDLGPLYGRAPRFALATVRDSLAFYSPSYGSDITSAIGTLILWIFFPSFVAYPQSGALRQLAIIYTVLAMCASCCTAIGMSIVLTPRPAHWKFSMAHVQNATLAGGVAIGVLGGFDCRPWLPLLVGMLAGGVCTMGFSHLQPLLQKICRLHDTCGIHNLHAMPALIGGVISIILPAASTQHPSIKVENQGIGLGVSLAMAIGGGLLSGFVCKWADPVPKKAVFRDDWLFDVPEGGLSVL